MTNTFLVSAACLASLILYLAAERRLLEKRRKAVELRIGVTGSRGKSSVTRLIAAGLREGGWNVMAKTTGSRPAVIFPDGSEEEIERPAAASVLEQKKILRLAARRGARALVAELMSIGPECLAAESGGIIKPSVLVLTSVRLDHRKEMGRTKAEIARSLSAAIRPGATVFLPDEEHYPAFDEAARRTGAEIRRVAKPAGRDLMPEPGREFEANWRLAMAVTRFAGIPDEIARRGMTAATPDLGAIRVWALSVGSPPRAWRAVSLFAANDPESALQALAKIRRIVPHAASRTVGLLNLREDREDRSRQWIEALSRGMFDVFRRIVFIGDRPRAWSRKKDLRSRFGDHCLAIAERSPRGIMNRLAAAEKAEALVVGLGNMAGPGRGLVELWEKEGIPVGS